MAVTAPRRALPESIVFVHHHLFKNAGTTVDWFLKRMLGASYLDHDEAIAAGLLSHAAILDFVLRRPDICGVSRHHVPFGLLVHPEREFLDILLVRHPIDRLRSVYDFMRVQPAGHDAVATLARQLNPRAFCIALLDLFPNQINNPQVTLIANAGDYTRPPDTEDARRAIDVVRRAAFTGTVERFDEACVAAEYGLRPKCGLLDCAYVAQNVTVARRKSLDDRLAAFRQACGQDVYDELVKQSELDFVLYQAADAELTRRVRLIPRLDDRLAVFRARCDHLRRAASIPDEVAPPAPVDRLLLASELDLPFYAVWEGVRFGHRDHGAALLGRGWGLPEHGHCWTDGPVASLWCRFTEPPDSDLVATFLATGFVDSSQPVQTVWVEANGAAVAVWQFHLANNETTGAHQEVQAHIPRQCLTGSTTLELCFRIEAPRQVANDGTAADTRALGLNLASMHLRRCPDGTDAG